MGRPGGDADRLDHDDGRVPTNLVGPAMPDHHERAAAVMSAVNPETDQNLATWPSGAPRNDGKLCACLRSQEVRI